MAQKPKPESQGLDLDKLIRDALTTLAVDTPYYAARLVGNRLELYLYGGRILTWPIPSSPMSGKDEEGTPPTSGGSDEPTG